LRLDYFNKNFKNLLPDLYSYFEALDITTDIFLLEWLISLYSKCMHVSMVARIWDNFILDGEIFAIRVGLAVLMYFSSTFMRQSHSAIVEQLQNLRSSNLDEDSLFDLLD